MSQIGAGSQDKKTFLALKAQIIADTLLLRVRKVTAATGVITTVAGNGAVGGSITNGSSAIGVGLNFPNGVAGDKNGNIYISDSFAFAILEVTSGLILTLAGDGTNGHSGDYGPATNAELNNPTDVAVNSDGSVLVADSSGRIRVLTPLNSSCAYTGVPATVPAAAGGNQNIAVGTTAFCPWTVSGLPSWIALTGLSAVTGPGNAALAVAANSGESRSATITIAGGSVAVTQAGGQGTPNLCDINQDGVVNVVDVQLMIDQALGKLAPLNDLNGDGIVNAVDVEIDSNAALNLGCSAKG